MIPLPCKDCITLAICKSRIFYLRETFTPTNTSLVAHLCIKCILIHTYAYNHSPDKKHYLQETLCDKAIKFLIS